MRPSAVYQIFFRDKDNIEIRKRYHMINIYMYLFYKYFVNQLFID